MNKLLKLSLLLTVVAAPAFAKDPKSYQVTGKVTAVDADVITVQKGKENFEIARGKDKTEVKTGDKVTVFYKMTADSVEAKPEAAKKKAAAK